MDFSRRMGESMDRDHVATLLFAHWPGQFSPWYGDLRRACSYTSALGKFITLDEYFTQTNLPGRLSRFSPDDYRAPYLKQAIIRRQADPLSIIQRTHQESWRQYLCAAAGTIGALASTAKGIRGWRLHSGRLQISGQKPVVGKQRRSQLPGPQSPQLRQTYHGRRIRIKQPAGRRGRRSRHRAS